MPKADDLKIPADWRPTETILRRYPFTIEAGLIYYFVVSDEVLEWARAGVVLLTKEIGPGGMDDEIWEKFCRQVRRKTDWPTVHFGDSSQHTGETLKEYLEQHPQ